MLKKIIAIAIFMLTVSSGYGQELQARVTIIAQKVSTQIDRKVFQTLQSGLTNFLNTRKWTRDVYQASEKINCNFLITIDQDLGNNIYRGKMTIQAARPVYNTTYDSPIMNFQDENVVFRYVEFQPIEFNENRVQGNDPMVANLTAILAYYANIILGLDYGSFSLRGGDEYFKKAWNIVNNAPESKEITGWKLFESLRNRYWLAENLNSTRYTLIHDALYNYYRSGLDVFFENEDAGRTGVLNSLNFLNTINLESPGSMIMQFFFQGKSNELVKLFTKASTEQKARARDYLTKLDITNANAYKELK
jgi:hypothetical protein